MKQSVLLRSSVSGEVFTGSRAEQQAFSQKLKLFDKGELERKDVTSAPKRIR